MPSQAQSWLVGWLGTSAAVASYEAPGDPWTIGVPVFAGWKVVGTLPLGSVPVTDGESVANVIDPAVATAVSIFGNGGVHEVALPAADWVDQWQGIGDLVPLLHGGYLLRGAPQLATVSPDGALHVGPLPAGYVVLGPTAIEKTWLLATTADASEAGALSESTPFSVYLWNDQDPATAPAEVATGVTLATSSSVGLAMLRHGDGSWWSLNAAGIETRLTPPTRAVTRLSPDGTWLASLDDGQGCERLGGDPCALAISPVSGGPSVQIPGPVSGFAFNGDQLAAVLDQRAALQIPWRLLVGPAANPEVVPLQ
jgi:hypothetical protein